MARKHITQFIKDESGFLHGFIRAHVDKVTGRAHFYDRAHQRSFTLDDAKEALRCGKAIEIHNNNGEWRTLVRSRIGTCVILSLDTLTAITVYYNDPSDNHDTLNHTLYHGGKAIDVVAAVKGLMAQKRY